MHSAADRKAELPVYGRDPFLALRHFIEPPSFTNLISRPVNAFWRKPCRALFHQGRFASNSLVASLMAVSALFLTLATAASIPSVVLLRRLRIGRAKSLVEIATRFRGGFGRYVVPMAMLHSIRTSHQTNFSSPTRSYEDESAHLSALPQKRTCALQTGMSAKCQKADSCGAAKMDCYSITSSAAKKHRTGLNPH